jgi:hypothetical protein
VGEDTYDPRPLSAARAVIETEQFDLAWSWPLLPAEQKRWAFADTAPC